jgi:hypothetical protein
MLGDRFCDSGQNRKMAADASGGRRAGRKRERNIFCDAKTNRKFEETNFVIQDRIVKCKLMHGTVGARIENSRWMHFPIRGRAAQCKDLFFVIRVGIAKKHARHFAIWPRIAKSLFLTFAVRCLVAGAIRWILQLRSRIAKSYERRLRCEK